MNEHWTELLNSDWHDYLGQGRDQDRLDQDEWLAKFLQRWPDLVPKLSPAVVREPLRRLRRLLHRLAVDFASAQPLKKGDLDALNAVLASSPRVQQVIYRDKKLAIAAESRRSGISLVLADIAASFAGLLVSGEPQRIKACRNPDCRWIFYDRSKNRSRQWCENATGCGNLIKVRQFRAKKKTAR